MDIHFPPAPEGTTQWEGQGGDLEPFAHPEPRQHPEPPAQPEGVQE